MWNIFARRIAVAGLLVISIVAGEISVLQAGPEFEAFGDTTVCEGDSLNVAFYANALFPEDELDFFMENAPAGAEFTNMGKCGE